MPKRRNAVMSQTSVPYDYPFNYNMSHNFPKLHNIQVVILDTSVKGSRTKPWCIL